MIKKPRPEKDERFRFLIGGLYEVGMTGLIIMANTTGIILLYDLLKSRNASRYEISIYILGLILFGTAVCSLLIYITRARVYSKKIQQICSVAQKVSKGDFSQRLDVNEDKRFKTEIDILMSDFNKMITDLSSVDKIRDNFISDVSHEIKTPLSEIQAYADLLKDGNLSEEKRAEYTDYLSVSIKKLSALVSNILKLNKIQNQSIVQNDEFYLDEQIRCSVLLFEEQIEKKNISLNIDLDEVKITSDEALLEMVWNNLISNAVKFTDFGGEISISLRKAKNKIQVKVKDNGCGISKKSQKHIFEKFYQEDSSRAIEGNGLGLALVYQIVKLLNGTIAVDSKTDKGTVFTVTL
ncbi:MAG: ATP-binding protein [Acutalibacteraceae bacterium]